MPQKNQDDEHYGDDDLDDGLLHCANHVVDQLRAVIDRNDFHARRKSGLNFFDLRFHAIDDIQRVLSVAHHHDAGDNFAFAIQIGKPAPQVGPHGNLADVLNADLGAGVADAQRDLREILERTRVPAAAHHVLRAAKLQQSSARFVVAAADRLNHPAHRDAVSPQTIRVEIHLVLAGIPADRRDLGHAGHRAKIVAQIPVLIGTQIGEAVLARGVHQGVLKHPTKRRRIGAEFGLDSFRQTRKDAGEILHDARARPVQVRSILENHVDVGVSEVRKSTNRFDLGRTEHRGDDRVGYLVFDDIRAPIPVGVNDDLCVAQVGNGVQRQRHHRPPTGDAGDGDANQQRKFVCNGEVDDSTNHRHLPFACLPDCPRRSGTTVCTALNRSSRPCRHTRECCPKLQPWPNLRASRNSDLSPCLSRPFSRER